MAQPHHFIRIKRHKLLYGRVPKAANSSIKAALCRLLSEMPPKGSKTTSDRFWQHETNQETELITLGRARQYRLSHFSFTFVRNPFDRLVAAYNNKVIENDAPPMPMQNMGITHGMAFDDFLDILIDTPLRLYDVHVLPQSQLLSINNTIVPKFVGRVEQINEHWAELRSILARKKINAMKFLPQKNVRRSDHSSLQGYFTSDALIEKAMRIYGDDVRLFYNDISVDQLIQNSPLPMFNTLHSKRLKLSKWLRSHGFEH